MDEVNIVPQWLFLYGTLILYLAIGIVVFVFFGRRATRRTRE